MKNITIDLPIESETDIQTMLGLYTGLLGSLKIQQPQGLGILGNFCMQLEVQLSSLFPADQWQAIQAEISESSQKAASFASANQSKFNDFDMEIKD